MLSAELLAARTDTPFYPRSFFTPALETRRQMGYATAGMTASMENYLTFLCQDFVEI
jgi:hypothetical protein